MKYEYLQSLQLYQDQGIRGKFKKPVRKRACNPYDLYGDQALSSSLILKMSDTRDFIDFKAMTEETHFLTQ